jgi:hypothetical protein
MYPESLDLAPKDTVAQRFDDHQLQLPEGKND